MDVEKCVDFEYRLNENAVNLSMTVEGKEVRRYMVPQDKRDAFPELKDIGTEKLTQIMSDLGISYIILPNNRLISSVGNFEDGFSIRGTNYDKFKAEYPEDAIRVDRELNPNALMPIYQ